MNLRYRPYIILTIIFLIGWISFLSASFADDSVQAGQSDSRNKLIEQYIEDTEKSRSKSPAPEEVKMPAVLKEEKPDSKEVPAEKTVTSIDLKKETLKLTAKDVAMPRYPPIVYQLDSDDVLDITVWKHPELTTEVVVRPDGRISFPLVGDIQAKGLTPVELKNIITQRLVDFGKKRSGRQNEEDREYVICSGDVLDISVWKVADLSREVIVRPDGMISFPLIGNLESTGKTLTQLDDELTAKLSTYVKEPQVSVMIRAFGSKAEVLEDVFLNEMPEVSVVIKKLGGKKVIVMGDVKAPGVFNFTTEIRIAEAVSLAGDFTKYAVRNSVVVIRGDINDKPEVIIADLVKLYKYGDFSQNILLQPQDIVFVPRTFVGNIADFIELIAPILDSVYRSQVISTYGI